MKSIFKLLVAAFLTVAPLTVTAQSNVAHINVQQLISEMPEVIAAQNELAKLEKDYTTQIDNAFKEFQTKLRAILQTLRIKQMLLIKQDKKSLKACRLICKNLEIQLLKNFKSVLPK